MLWLLPCWGLRPPPQGSSIDHEVTTYNTWACDPGGWTICDLGTKCHVTCNTVLKLLFRLDNTGQNIVEITIKMKTIVRKPWSDQLASHIKLLYLLLSPSYILQIVLMASKHITLFILKVLEAGGWKSTTLRETRLCLLFKALNFEFWKPKISRSSKSHLLTQVYWLIYSRINQSKWLSLLINSQQKFWLPWRVIEHRTS